MLSAILLLQLYGLCVLYLRTVRLTLFAVNVVATHDDIVARRSMLDICDRSKIMEKIHFFKSKTINNLLLLDFDIKTGRFGISKEILLLSYDIVSFGY